MAAIATQFLDKNVENTLTTTACDILGDTVIYTSDTLVEITNGDASPHQVTIPVIDSACECAGAQATLSNIVVSIPAGESRVFQVTDHYNSNVSGGITFNYDAVTSMTISAYRAA